MKKFIHARFTLRPLIKGAAFFAFSVFLFLVGCRDSSVEDNTREQGEVLSAMAAVLDKVAMGGDETEAVVKLEELGERLKQLKIDLSRFQKEDERVRESVGGYEGIARGGMELQEAKEKLFQKGRFTPEIGRALMAHHNPDPMPGEGISR